MAAFNEIKQAVPAELARECCGIAIDMGASAFKAVYRSKEDSEEVKNKDLKVGHLTVLSASGKHMKEAVEHLASRAEINRDQAGGTIYTTGLGCTVNGKFISEKLNVKLENQTEFDCFVKAFYYLASHVPRSQLFEEFDVTAAEKPLAAFRQHYEILKSIMAEGKTAISGVELGAMADPMEAFGVSINDPVLPVAEAEKDLYPCLLAMCGSGFGFMLVNADGSFRILDSSNRGGRNFLGLGALLTGSETYDELVSLAARGNARSVDMYSDAMLAGCERAEGEDSMYTRSSAAEATLLYCFGKTVGSKLEDFKKEDLASALANQFVLDMVQTTMLVASVAGVRRVCFSGSFLASEYLRRSLTVEWIKRGVFLALVGQTPIKFDFIKAGPQMGAIGALVSHYEKHVRK